jgi:hypothetical protein
MISISETWIQAQETHSEKSAHKVTGGEKHPTIIEHAVKEASVQRMKKMKLASSSAHEAHNS